MLTPRDFIVATVAVFGTVAVMAFAQSTKPKPVMHSSVFAWDNLKVESKPTGERREVFDAPTATLDRFECHITTLNPGEAPHAPHRHPEEEMMILKEGTLDVLQNDKTTRLEAGGIIFCASNELHGLRNVGKDRATYFVFKFYPPGLAKAESK